MGSSLRTALSEEATIEPSSDRRRMAERLRITRQNGIPVNLTCDREETSMTPLNVLELFFDYEFAINDPHEGIEEVLMQDLPKYEYGLLYEVALSTGVLTCNLGRQNIRDFVKGTLASEPLVMGLSSSLHDDWDSRVEGCEYLIDIPVGLICVPVRGMMRAEFSGEQSDGVAVGDYLIHQIEKGINSGLIRSGGIKKALFLGERAPRKISVSSSGSEHNSDNRSVALASAIPAAAFVVIALYALMTRRRRRRSQETTKALQVHEVEPDLAPTKSADSRSTAEGKSDAENAAQDVEQPSVVSHPVLLLPTHTPDKDPEEAKSADAVAEEPPDQDIGKATETPIVELLPPLPPIGPTSKPVVVSAKPIMSKTMKQRRKKKKKKKQRIVRVNSRESIKEMETISEGAEENTSNEDEDEEGSECSWETDSNPSSRDVSPAPSRDPSPARSRGSAGDDQPETPVRHGPDGKRLPPTWV